MVRERIIGHSSARVPFIPPLISFLHPTSDTFVVSAGRCRIHCQDPECPSSLSLSYSSLPTVALLRSRVFALHRSLILTRSRSAMAQFAGEPLISVALEGISASVPLTFALTPSVPLVTPGFYPLVPGTP